ncbi:family 43 glycosylhydrolase [Mucilaginibacter sp. HMF5004]|uniref:family 43 glycosylhydrolase n=1 Tax=Mucilaginibacter rivuli TaxID=2857527 RepID=UPI001C5EFCE1|nr:family 43 glycosylhydrolase [Mucilaginibacter rivuli]MBW4888516.1 family 43 glycosylhydrolase [Mucilaginibacter rivuli]
MYFRSVNFCGSISAALLVFALLGSPSSIKGQDTQKLAAGVKTYVNPVIAGDHPDPTLLKVGDDFYMCGSSFHFVPNLPILHSRDLIHWETIARVVPANWSDLKSGAPGAGVWQGAITYFYGSYRIYFSNGSGGGQYFSTAVSPAGPWTLPVKVKTTAETGFIGYDNSIFVDDDGTPYMIIKPGQTTNRMQQIGRDGHLTGKLINMDWVNRNKKYSWAEGPVMCKRDGWYYYLMAGDVTGGQFILRSRSLTADSSKWENLGNVFDFSKDPKNRFRSVNHMSTPWMLKDGTWWCIAQSYDAPIGNDWSGQGRQDLLLQVQWTPNGKPFVPYPSDEPLARPNLPDDGSHWCFPVSDEFATSSLNLTWHFLNKEAAGSYSLTERPGWLRLKPQGGKTHILQKEAGHDYALVTKVDIDATAANEQAGIYITSGNETEHVRLYSGYDEGKKIGFSFGKQSFNVSNTIGNIVWLKLERHNHDLSGFCSPDGVKWTAIGNVIDARDIDKTQPNYNAWVGTSDGLFAQGKQADFDLFLYKDGFAPLAIAGCNNYYGLKLSDNGVTNTGNWGWAMLGGIDIGSVARRAKSVSITAAGTAVAKVEVWIDNIGGNGKLIASIAMQATGGENKWDTFSANIKPTTGQHDVYLRIVGSAQPTILKTLKFN